MQPAMLRSMHAGILKHKGIVQRMVQPGGIGHATTSDTIKSRSKCPCLLYTQLPSGGSASHESPRVHACRE